MAKILICDDASFIRKVIKDILEEAGHAVVDEAETVREAIEKYKKYVPDLVTLDIMMDISGASAVKKIKKTDPKAKIIIVTILNERDKEVVEAIKSGANGFVSKPIKKGELLGEVERILKQ